MVVEEEEIEKRGKRDGQPEEVDSSSTLHLAPPKRESVARVAGWGLAWDDSHEPFLSGKTRH